MRLGNKLRIGFVGPLVPQKGGSAISCTQIIEGLADAGHSIDAVAPILETDTEDALAARRPDIRIRRFPVPYFDVDPQLRPSARHAQAEEQGVARLLPLMMAEHRPDVLVVRDIYALYSMDLAAEHDTPVVVLSRGNPTTAILRGVYPADLCEPYLREFRRATLIIAVAKHVADGLRELGMDQALAIPNAVDAKRFAPHPKSSELLVRLGATEEDRIGVFVGHVKPLKRPLDILRSAVAALRSDPLLLYVFLGDGASLGEAKEAARSLGVADRCRFPGRISNDEMPEFFNLADFTIAASESEGLSRAHLETMASGGVLIASDIPGSRELVRDGVNGFLFPMGDTQELARITVRVAGDPALRERIGSAALETASHHHIEDALQAYSDLLRGVARRSRSGVLQAT